MKKKAGEINKGDKIVIAGKLAEVKEVEQSDIGKQGSKKCRIVVQLESGESMTLIRPSDYPIEIK